MCISVLSTSHPEYPFVLISNRDEYINRPTLVADWWDEPYKHILGGRDTQRKERGTWLGITKQGRIAILTNFREEGVEINKDKSRGAITNSYLCIDPDSTETDEEYVRRLLNDVGIHDVGGFTLIFGKLRKPNQVPSPENEVGIVRAESSTAVSRLNMLRDHQSPITSPSSPSRTTAKPKKNPASPSLCGSAASGLAVISNRTETASSLKRIATHIGETHGLSNSHFGDVTWPKVVHGELRLQQTIKMDVLRGGDEAKFIEGLFDILCVDTLPNRKETENWDEYVRHMRDSIMISPAKGELAKQMAGYIPASTSLKASAGTTNPPPESSTAQAASGSVAETSYGTSKQTVILVNKAGKVTYVERTLYDQHGTPIPEGERDVRFEFDIEGWS